VVPAYDEQDSLESTIRALYPVLESTGVKFEVIVVDDGSTDHTWRRLEELKSDYPALAALKHETNIGYGAAIKTGISKSSFDRILIVDADQTYPLEDIPLLLRLSHDYDMVVGSRTDPDAQIPWMRKPAKFALTWLAQFLSGRSIPDLNSGFRIFRKTIATKHFHVFPDGFSFTSTLTLLCLHEGSAIRYVPIRYFIRKGRSKIRPVTDTFNFVQLIIRTVLYVNPLRIFIPASFFFLGISGILFLIRVLFYRAFLATIIITFICGFQLLVVGMLADLIDKRLR
jgi:glycosyltransferase involved in cell wall biosynthesis